MKREQLEHVLRAASNVTNDKEFLVVGSAAILGTYAEDDLPAAATRSDEADLSPFGDDDGSRSMQIEGSLGQGSMFHDTFGYYADGVDTTTAILPHGWEERLVRFETPGSAPGSGLCLEKHDLAVSKLVAGRPKDYEFVEALLDAGMLDLTSLRNRLADTPRHRAIPGFVTKAERWLERRRR